MRAEEVAHVKTEDEKSCRKQERKNIKRETK